MLSATEIKLNDTGDQSRDKTRCLDYYAMNNSRIKWENSVMAGTWYLRTALHSTNYQFRAVTRSGSLGADNAGSGSGVSPAFRIG